MGKDPLIGQRLGDYVVEEVVAAGGMGIVYRAKHPLLGRSVAVKVLRAQYARDQVQTARFLQEAQVLSGLRHPGLVDVFNFGHLADGRQYMMMELLAGETLGQLLQREGKLPAARALALVDQMLEALAAAHKAGVVHRDLKPSNVFLARQSDGNVRLKLLDFGLAKQLAPGEGALPGAKASLVGGTPQYISPEQAEGLAATARSDLYAVGGMLFQMLSGRVAFVGDEWGYLLRAHVTVPAPALSTVLPNVARPLEQLVAQLLEKKPERRPASADEVRREVARLQESLEAKGARPRLLAAAAFAGLVVAGAAGTFFALGAWGDAPAPLEPAPVAPPALPVAPTTATKREPTPAPAPAPAMDEQAFKAAMAAAVERERQATAQHRDRELVMGIKQLTEQGVPEGREKEVAEQIFNPALRGVVEGQRVAEERGRADSEITAEEERLSVLRESCKQAEWKRAAGAKLDREMAARLAAMMEDGLPSGAQRMQALRAEAGKVSKGIARAATQAQCVEALTRLDRFVARNVVR